MDDVKHFIALMKSKLKRLERDTVEQVSKDIEKGARRNFNSARNKVSTDNPNVTVFRTKGGQKEATVTCVGDQVLFIEFGVGHSNSFLEGGVRPAFGFDRDTGKETAPRPTGIYPLGYYNGKTDFNATSFNALVGFLRKRHIYSHGMDEFWVRPSTTGVPRLSNEREVHRRNRDGDIIGTRTDVVWTQGHPPMRALWRARGSALKKLYNPRVKRIAMN